MEEVIKNYQAAVAVRSLFRLQELRVEPNDGEMQSTCSAYGPSLVEGAQPSQSEVGHVNNNPILTESGVMRLTSKRARGDESSDERERESPKRCKRPSKRFINGSRIFVIPEIVEAILLRMPILDLTTTCRRVCTTWRDLVDDSLSIKRYIASIKASEGIFTQQALCGNFPNLSLTPTARDFIQLFWRKLLRLYMQQVNRYADDEESQSWHSDDEFVNKLYELYTAFVSRVLQITTFPPLPEGPSMARGILLTKATNIPQSAIKDRDSSPFEQKFGSYPASDEHTIPNILYLQCFKAYHRLFDNRINRAEIIRLTREKRMKHCHDADFLNFWAVYRKEWAVFFGDVVGRDAILEESHRQNIERDRRRHSAEAGRFAILFDMRDGGSVKEQCERGEYSVMAHSDCKARQRA
ncbi:hypothetical protein TWF281_004816 [Arthrobotrys megalospora]